MSGGGGGEVRAAPSRRAEVCTEGPQIVQVTVGPYLRSGDSVYCGDEVEVNVSISTFGFDGVVYVEFKNAANDARIDDAIEAAGGRLVVPVRWVAKKPDDNWTSDPDVKVVAKLADREAHVLSEREAARPLHINRYRNDRLARCLPGGRVSAAKWVENGSGGYTLENPAGYGWSANYDVEFRDGTIYVYGRIKLVPQSGLTITAAMKQSWKQEIEGYWNGLYRAHRRDCGRGSSCPDTFHCCKYDIQIVCDFVDSGELTRVDVHPGAAAGPWGSESWWYSSRWWQNTSDNVPESVRAHEFGHNIGLYDEYAKGALAPGIDPNTYTFDRRSIMKSGRHPRQNHFTAWLASLGTMVNERLRVQMISGARGSR